MGTLPQHPYLTDEKWGSGKARSGGGTQAFGPLGPGCLCLLGEWLASQEEAAFLHGGWHLILGVSQDITPPRATPQGACDHLAHVGVGAGLGPVLVWGLSLVLMRGGA